MRYDLEFEGVVHSARDNNPVTLQVEICAEDLYLSLSALRHDRQLLNRQQTVMGRVTE